MQISRNGCAFCLMVVLSCVFVVHSQYPVNINVVQCSSSIQGTCRPQCQPSEFAFYPLACATYIFYFGRLYQYCVKSLPCCAFPGGTCRSSCGSGELTLAAQVTCSNSAGVCCVPNYFLGVQAGTSTAAATTTPATTTTAATTVDPSSVAGRQGECGRVTNISSRAAEGRYFVQPRLIGGTEAGELDWPWMVRITYTTTSGFCAGVLVDDDTVVTVAHCVAGVSSSSMQVTVGDYDTSRFDLQEEVVDVASSAVISGFQRGTRGQDFAVLKLSRAIRFNDRKLPACLYDPTIPLVTPLTCHIAGWGVRDVGNQRAVGGVLRSTNVDVLLNKGDCESRITATSGNRVTLPNDVICTNNPAGAPTDGCLFDDGDMLVCLDSRNRWSLIGLMSEYSCGDTSLPIIFTDVRSYVAVTLQEL